MPNKLRSKLKKNQFYCVVCRKRVTAPGSAIEVDYDKNDRPRFVAEHSACNTMMYKYIPAKWENSYC